MSNTDIAEDTPTRRRRWGAVGTIGLMGAIIAGTAGTSALFTDQEVITDNTFSSGTFELNVDQLDGDGIATDARLTVENFSPGDVEEFDIRVENAGTLDLRYAITGGFDVLSEDDGALNLGQALTLEILDSEGTVLNNDGTAALGEAASSDTALVGDSAEGPQAGDREVTAENSEDLTIRVTYPEGTGNQYAGTDAVLTLTVDAEQTANNDGSDN